MIRQRIIDIEHCTTRNTVHMTMRAHIGVETPDTGARFDDIDQSGLIKGHQGSVYRIERQAGKIVSKRLKNIIGRRMSPRLHQIAIDRNPLEGNLHPMLTAMPGERLDICCSYRLTHEFSIR